MLWKIKKRPLNILEATREFWDFLEYTGTLKNFMDLYVTFLSIPRQFYSLLDHYRKLSTCPF